MTEKKCLHCGKDIGWIYYEFPYGFICYDCGKKMIERLFKMNKKYFDVSFENNGCSECLFLNSSDTGEDCKILRSDIEEDEWSNIDYKCEENWRYAGCPLIHHENLNENKGILNISEFKELKW